MQRPISILTTLVAASALTLAGCAGSAESSTTTQPSSASSPTAGDQQGGDASQAGRGPGNGTSGLIADVSGSTLQVQGTSGQTAVTYTAKTTFTSEVAGSAADLAAGLCVAGMGTTSDGTVTAARLSLTTATDEGCADGPGADRGGERPGGDQGGTPGEPPSGAPTDMPSGMPTDRPSGAPDGDAGEMTNLSGQITKVDGHQVTVKATDSTETTFTLSDETSISKTEKTTAKAAKVGVCAMAQGDTDSTGAVAATSVRLSEATDGACTAGGMGGGRR